jgi:cholesterol transport system auxiliary component
MTAKGHAQSLVLAGMVFLAGCAGLLGGGGRPANLYRFGNTPVSATEPDRTAPGPIQLVAFRGADFPVESRGDRILTMRGPNAAYVAQSRWIAPAADLFDTALRREFARSLAGVRLVAPAKGPRADFVLSIDVRRFEAAYEGGEAPVIAMEANIKLLRSADRAIIGEWTFSSRKPAAENKVSAIVSAYDEATSEMIGHIKGVVSQLAGQAPHPVS